MRRVIVAGGSVGGLFAANLLRRAGWDVLVLERAASSLGDRGTGIGTRDELFAVMRRIGLTLDATIGVEVQSRIGLNRSGEIVHQRPVRAVTSAWSRVWRPLKGALPDELYRSASAVMQVADASCGLVAVLDDGTRIEADLLVGADGLHSTVRSQYLPDVTPAYAGYVAWRGVVDEHQVSAALGDFLFNHMVFGFPEGELALSLPMPGPDDGPRRRGRRCHFVWFRPASEADLAALCTDASGRCYGVSIPPPLIRPELIAGVRVDADRLLAPQLAALVHATPQIILQPIFDLQSPRIAFGRVALLGDAAFVARPHVASGVMKAAIDAETLADALAASAGDVVAALARYEAARQPYGAWLVARGRHIGQYFVARDGDPQTRIATVMQEYGAAGLVLDQPMQARVPA